MFLAFTQQQQIDVPENSWVGHTSMAGFGIILLTLAFLCIKGNKKSVQMGPWGPMFGVLMNKAITEPSKRVATKWGGGSEGFDWRSLMTFLIGMWAMTSILSSSPGSVLSLAEWGQDLILRLRDWPILGDIGAGGLCFVLFFLAMRNKDDDKQDLIFGAVCGLLFPLGGGVFAQITLQIGQWVPQIMQNPFS